MVTKPLSSPSLRHSPELCRENEKKKFPLEIRTLTARPHAAADCSPPPFRYRLRFTRAQPVQQVRASFNLSEARTTDAFEARRVATRCRSHALGATPNDDFLSADFTTCFDVEGPAHAANARLRCRP